LIIRGRNPPSHLGRRENLELSVIVGTSPDWAVSDELISYKGTYVGVVDPELDAISVR
jgi:hypothetical protein